MNKPDWIDSVKYDAQGLVPAVVQDDADGTVLMVAYMNKEALLETLERRRGVFFSRSRNKMWRKGEESGNHQEVKSIALDCDKDCVLIRVNQIGGRRLPHRAQVLLFPPRDERKRPRHSRRGPL
jgi:phosphoribosyl-AMP cyclohydrolase